MNTENFTAQDTLPKIADLDGADVSYNSKTQKQKK